MEIKSPRPLNQTTPAPSRARFALPAAALALAAALASETPALIASGASASAIAVADAVSPVAIEIESTVMDRLSSHGSADVFMHLDVAPDDDDAIARAQTAAADFLGAGFHLTHRYIHVPAIAGRLTRSGLERIGLAHRLGEEVHLGAAPSAPMPSAPMPSAPSPAAALPSSRVPIAAIALDPVITPYDLDLETSVRFIGGDRVRRAGHSGRNVNVAVLDTGVDTRNLDLSAAIVAQLCTLEPASRCGPEAHPADDTDGHGTHVAGIVASRGRRGGFGVAPDAGIIAVKFLETRGVGVGSNFVGALDLLLERDDVHLINMSLGSPTGVDGDCDDLNAYTRSLAAAFGRLMDAGVTSIAASGNDGARNAMGAPACIASVVSVGAIDHTRREIASFTNRSSTLDLLAPGVGIVATSIRGGTSTKSGTSMAAPHVAGAMAVLKGAVPWAGPDLLEQVLKDNGQRPTIRIGEREITTIKLDTALDALVEMTPTATAIGPTATSVPTETQVQEPTEPLPTPTESSTPSVGTPTSTPGTPDPTPAEPTPTPTEARVEQSATPGGGGGTPVPGGMKLYLPQVAK